MNSVNNSVLRQQFKYGPEQLGQFVKNVKTIDSKVAGVFKDTIAMSKDLSSRLHFGFFGRIAVWFSSDASVAKKVAKIVGDFLRLSSSDKTQLPRAPKRLETAVKSSLPSSTNLIAALPAANLPKAKVSQPKPPESDKMNLSGSFSSDGSGSSKSVVSSRSGLSDSASSVSSSDASETSKGSGKAKARRSVKISRAKVSDGLPASMQRFVGLEAARQQLISARS